MNICRALLIGVASLFLHMQLYAQSRDIDGYYINLKGDTVFGKFPNYRESSNSPTDLPFQVKGSYETISLSPAICQRISVATADNYVAYRGKRQTNATNYNNAQMADTANLYEDISAFLRELYNDGHYHLYQFLDKRRSNFYVSEDDKPLRELSYKEYLINGNAVESFEYRLQLQDFFRPVLEQDPEKQRFIVNVSYSSSSLMDLFSKMLTGRKASGSKNKYPPGVFVGFGASVNSLRVTTGAGFAGINVLDEAADYPSQSSPLFGAGIKLYSQRNFGRLFFTLRVDYYHFQHAHNFDDAYPGAFIDPHTVTTFKSNVISLPVGVGYKIISSKGLTVDLSAGASYLLLLHDSELHVTDSTNTVSFPDRPRHNALGFFGEAEIVLSNKFSFFGGIYTPVSITLADDYNASHSSFRFGARYYIFK